MNVSFKPSPVLAIWVPGFSLAVFVLLSLNRWEALSLSQTSLPEFGVWRAIIVVVLSFVVGQFLDAVRDVLLENFVFDKFCGTVKWQFFFEAPKEKLENLEEWFYTWYELDANLFVGLIIAMLLCAFGKVPANRLTWVLMVAGALFFFVDALELRKWFRTLIDDHYNSANTTCGAAPKA
jgi:uncharacterized membrane protein